MIQANRPKDTFPRASYRVDNGWVSFGESTDVRITNVYHASTRANSGQTISILQTYHLESTMLRFRRAEIHERSCGFSSGLAERTIFGYLAVAGFLKNSLSMRPIH